MRLDHEAASRQQPNKLLRDWESEVNRRAHDARVRSATSTLATLFHPASPAGHRHSPRRGAGTVSPGALDSSKSTRGADTTGRSRVCDNDDERTRRAGATMMHLQCRRKPSPATGGACRGNNTIAGTPPSDPDPSAVSPGAGVLAGPATPGLVYGGGSRIARPASAYARAMTPSPAAATASPQPGDTDAFGATTRRQLTAPRTPATSLHRPPVTPRSSRGKRGGARTGHAQGLRRQEVEYDLNGRRVSRSSARRPGGAELDGLVDSTLNEMLGVSADSEATILSANNQGSISKLQAIATAAIDARSRSPLTPASSRLNVNVMNNASRTGLAEGSATTRTRSSARNKGASPLQTSHLKNSKSPFAAPLLPPPTLQQRQCQLRRASPGARGVREDSPNVRPTLSVADSSSGTPSDAVIATGLRGNTPPSSGTSSGRRSSGRSIAAYLKRRQALRQQRRQRDELPGETAGGFRDESGIVVEATAGDVSRIGNTVDACATSNNAGDDQPANRTEDVAFHFVTSPSWKQSSSGKSEAEASGSHALLLGLSSPSPSAVVAEVECLETPSPMVSAWSGWTRAATAVNDEDNGGDNEAEIIEVEEEDRHRVRCLSLEDIAREGDERDPKERRRPHVLKVLSPVAAAAKAVFGNILGDSDSEEEESDKSLDDDGRTEVISRFGSSQGDVSIVSLSPEAIGSEQHRTSASSAVQAEPKSTSKEVWVDVQDSSTAPEHKKKEEIDMVKIVGDDELVPEPAMVTSQTAASPTEASTSAEPTIVECTPSPIRSFCTSVWAADDDYDDEDDDECGRRYLVEDDGEVDAPATDSANDSYDEDGDEIFSLGDEDDTPLKMISPSVLRAAAAHARTLSLTGGRLAVTSAAAAVGPVGVRRYGWNDDAVSMYSEV